MNSTFSKHTAEQLRLVFQIKCVKFENSVTYRPVHQYAKVLGVSLFNPLAPNDV